jgi:hypothetical protein
MSLEVLGEVKKKNLISILSQVNKNLDQEWRSIISSTPLFKMLKTSSNKTSQ